MQVKKRRRNCVSVCFSCPIPLLDLIDDLAAEQRLSRSEQIIELLKANLELPTVEITND